MIQKKALLLFVLLGPLSAFADYDLKDKSELIGVWVVEETAPKLEVKRRSSTQEMEFKSDGSYISSAIDFRANASARFKAFSTYKIEHGMLLIGKPGRVGKFDRFKVYEKENDRMILKGGLEGFYFLRKK